jgi:hypothetical protein
MAETVREDPVTGPLTVVRLLQNPLGAEAPAGQRGDMVRVTDGRSRVYLLPGEFDKASPTDLRWLLARGASLRPPADRDAR